MVGMVSCAGGSTGKSSADPDKLDAGLQDASPLDAAHPDAAPEDAALPDASIDASIPDAGLPDAVPAPTCLEGGVPRLVVPPSAGQLVITEVMPDPAATSDQEGEWFEVLATSSFDLNGIGLGKNLGAPGSTIADANCLPVSDGDRLLFAHSSDSGANGGLPTPDFLFAFGLTNTGDTLVLELDGELLDAVSWASSTAGRSLSLDPSSESATDNDIEGNWCEGSGAYGAGDEGTPRAPNLPCDMSGMCIDGGLARALVPPLPADVSITEIMANPAAVADTNGEYFELHFASAADLNGLQIGKELNPALVVSTTLSDINCLSVPANTHVVFARRTDPLINGGLPTTNIFLSGIALPQTAGTDYPLFVAIENQIVDSVVYNGSNVAAGASMQINGSERCLSTTPYGDGDLGSPGNANEGCN